MRDSVFQSELEEAFWLAALRRAGPQRPGEPMFDYLDRVKAELSRPEEEREPGAEG